MIRFRLHPAAKIPPLDRLWLFLNSKRGYLQISSGTTLQDDIEGAVVVIGMGTTVLEEALLLNRPVIQLLHPDYSQYLDLGQLEGVTILDYRAFSGTCLQNVRKISIVNTQTRERLGLCNKIVTFERLFSDTSFRDNGAFN